MRIMAEAEVRLLVACDASVSMETAISIFYRSGLAARPMRLAFRSKIHTKGYLTSNRGQKLGRRWQGKEIYQVPKIPEATEETHQRYECHCGKQKTQGLVPLPGDKYSHEDLNWKT